MDYQTFSDEALIKIGSQGDHEAVDALLAKYKPMVIAKARAFFLVGSDLDDLIQEGMIGLFKAMRDFHRVGEGQFHYFADLCVTRQMISAIRAAGRKKHHPLNRAISFHAPVDDDATITVSDVLEDKKSVNPEKSLLETEWIEELNKVIDEQLSDMEKKVFHHYLKGLSYEKIATKVDGSSKMVDNALQRIKRKLNQHIERDKKS